MQPILRMQIVPDWDEIDRVRERSAVFFREHGLSTDAVDALQMVVCELTENAVKYGSFRGDAPEISVMLSIQPRVVTVEVKSPVGQIDDETVGRLDYTIQWIRGYQDPFEAYLERVKEVSAQHITNTESRLGLVRIAYEGHSILDFYVNDENILAVSAMYPLDSEPGAHS
jgi:hypothetical protein